MDTAHYWFQGAGPSYLVGDSLRFRGAQHLSRSFASPGNLKTWTWSGWVKKVKVIGSGSRQGLFGVGPQSPGSGYFCLSFCSSIVGIADGILVDRSGARGPASNAVFRDASAWYHLVFAIDTTLASKRTKVYANGIELTSWNDDNDHVWYQNDVTMAGSTTEHRMGQFYQNGEYFEGYMADVHFIAGQALPPTAFGEFNADGVWVPKKYSGSYGTNGFRLDFSDPANIGADRSGNNNNFTANGFQLTNPADLETYDLVFDSPTSNIQVLNPLNRNSDPMIGINNAGLTGGPYGNACYHGTGTHLFTGGKWYFEYSARGVGGVYNTIFNCGVMKPDVVMSGNTYDHPDFWALSAWDGNKVNDGTSSPYAPGTGSGPVGIIGCAFDLDNGKIWWSRNGVWPNGGNPATGANPAFSNVPRSVIVGMAIGGGGYSGHSWYNFGQLPYSHTPPTGFNPLDTADLSSVALPATITGTFTGNGSADGPFIYTGCTPGRIQYGTVDVTYGNRLASNDVDFLANGFKVRSTASNSGTVNYTVTTTHSDGEHNGKQVPFGGAGRTPANACSN